MDKRSNEGAMVAIYVLIAVLQVKSVNFGKSGNREIQGRKTT